MIFNPCGNRASRAQAHAAAGLIVLGLLALGAVVVIATAQGVIDQTAEISDSVNAASLAVDRSISIRPPG